MSSKPPVDYASLISQLNPVHKPAASPSTLAKDPEVVIPPLSDLLDSDDEGDVVGDDKSASPPSPPLSTRETEPLLSREDEPPRGGAGASGSEEADETLATPSPTPTAIAPSELNSLLSTSTASFLFSSLRYIPRYILYLALLYAATFVLLYLVPWLFWGIRKTFDGIEWSLMGLLKVVKWSCWWVGRTMVV
ncbi:hypothetical protein MNV49_006370 [Pseudohyphozyma bogoriensis]|nr:hypothetical protein MNV49_006370 [Pseudohyphozyma bogoriensis]